MSDEIDRTLRALPGGTRYVLEVGALHGDPFDVATVEEVLGVADVSVEVAAARDAGLIVGGPGGWSFRQPELAQQIQLSLGRDRRAQLHTAIGLAAFAVAPGRNTDLVADAHFRRGDGSVDVQVRLSTAVRAGRRALSLGAWGRAVDAFEFVRAHFDELDANDAERAAIALDTATAFVMDDQPEAARPMVALALQLAERTGDTELLGQAALRAIRNRLSARFLIDDEEWPELRHLRAVAEADGNVATRVEAWVTLADVAFVRHQEAEGRRCSAIARQLAEGSGIDQLRALADYAEGLQQLGRLDVRASVGQPRPITSTRRARFGRALLGARTTAHRRVHVREPDGGIHAHRRRDPPGRRNAGSGPTDRSPRPNGSACSPCAGSTPRPSRAPRSRCDCTAAPATTRRWR